MTGSFLFYLFIYLFTYIYLYVPLELDEVVSVPRDEPGSLVREVHTPEAGLSATEKRLAHGVVVRPHKVVVNGDVFEQSDVPIRAEQLLVAACGDDQFWVYGPLGLVQSVHKRAPLSRVQRQNVSSD